MAESRINEDDDSKQELEIYKRLTIAEIEQWYDTIPEEERDQPALISQDYGLTPNQILKEVREFSEKGRLIAEMLSRARIELAKREVE